MHSQNIAAKWRPFCQGGDELKGCKIGQAYHLLAIFGITAMIPYHSCDVIATYLKIECYCFWECLIIWWYQAKNWTHAHDAMA